MKLVIALIILSILQLSFIAKSQDGRLQVKINEQVEVHNQKKLSLYDIVELENANSTQLNGFKNAIVENQFLQNEFQLLSTSLVRDHRDLFRSAQLSLPEVIKVKKTSGKNSEILSQEQIKRDIRNQIKSLCKECDVTLTQLTVPQFQVIDESEVKVDFSNLTLKNTFLSPITVSDKHGLRQFWLSGQLKIERPVYVLKRSLNAGQILKDEDLILSKKESVTSQVAIDNKDQLVNARLIRSLQKGSVIKSSDLKMQYAIQRGESVKVVSQNEDFELSIEAISEQNGLVGEVVKLKNPNSRKELTGVVTAKGVVELQ